MNSYQTNNLSKLIAGVKSDSDKESKTMRFTIYKYQNNKAIGHINFDDMDFELLKALHALGYRVEVEPLPQPTK